MTASEQKVTTHVPMCRQCGKLTPGIGPDWVNYSNKEDALRRAESHTDDTGHTVDLLVETVNRVE